MGGSSGAAETVVHTKATLGPFGLRRAFSTGSRLDPRQCEWSYELSLNLWRTRRVLRTKKKCFPCGKFRLLGLISQLCKLRTSKLSKNGVDVLTNVQIPEALRRWADQPSSGEFKQTSLTGREPWNQGVFTTPEFTTQYSQYLTLTIFTKLYKVGRRVMRPCQIIIRISNLILVDQFVDRRALTEAASVWLFGFSLLFLGKLNYYFPFWFFFDFWFVSFSTARESGWSRSLPRLWYQPFHSYW